MSKLQYIRAVERALREDVLPLSTEPVARDSLASCISILAALGSSLAAPDSSAASRLDKSAWPAALRAAFDKGLAAALPAGIPDDLAVKEHTAGQLTAAQAWLRAEGALDFGAAAVRQLLEWERAERAPAMAHLAEVAKPAATAGKSSAGDLEREPLQAYFSRRFGPKAVITEFRRVMGGRSRQTALFSQSGVGELPANLVLQRDSLVATGSPSVTVQGPVLAAAHRTGMLAPQPWFVEASPEPLGAAFMVVDRLPGRPAIDATTEYFSAPPAGLERIAIGLAKQMAILHGMPIEPLQSGLTFSFDRERGTWVDEIARLRARIDELTSGPSLAVNVGMAWLERYAPQIGVRWCVVHTDMLLHNLLVDRGELTGVLDWELTHIGHPGEDLGYVRPVIEQVLPWQDFMAAYSTAGGAAMTRIESDFFSLYASIRLLTLVQYPKTLFERGATNDLRLAEVGAAFIPQLVDRIDRVLKSVLA